MTSNQGDIPLIAPPGVPQNGGPPSPPSTCSIIDPLCFMKHLLRAFYYYTHALEGGYPDKDGHDEYYGK